ncbi:Zinc finger, RING-type [Penicillium occitanis (nom. inval.)]|nr:hypothetical protein PENOC_105100 [Penicillium occitanis (nom. inval.)]PCH04340.1 Zinc finger, RING-type [Penicillium occitanis (nom. inval.)]
MRPPRLLLLIFCFIFLPILLTFLSLVTAEPRRGVDEGDAPIAGRSSRLRALFSFNTPTSLFPPSAIISLTDDNSTFFLARPAAFGPLLPSKGLSGQIWIGSGFSEDTLRKGVGTAGFQGELGCSDVPGWDEDGQAKQDKVLKETHTIMPANPATDKETIDKRKNTDSDHTAPDKSTGPAPNDGTDDHLHHSFSTVKDENSSEKQPPTHADIQSLQESAEIAGKVVLLSRGGCGFLEKVKWVQRRGGVALIVGDDTRGGSLITMYARGDTSNVTIPAVFTSYTTAHLLSSLIPERATLEGQKETDSKKVSADQKRPSKPTTTTTKITSLPTNTRVPKKDPAKKEELPKTKGNTFFSAIWSLFGFGRDESLTDDSRRPPSSGNIDWVLVDDYEEEENVSKSKSVQSGKDKAKTAKPKKVDNSPVDGDGFEIGVHDWRDPDLVPTKSSAKGEFSSAEKTESKKKDEKADSKTDSNLKGGFITPGSGEYSHMVKVPADKTDKNGADVDDETSDSDEKSWFARHFGWNEGLDDELDQILKSHVQPTSTSEAYVREGEQALSDHHGLWVTLTPTSMSTSPFFDTLLVLVVSPLITLTVVYALLLLRSRIRRRRWRAPKSVVERLPIRTYHTITQSTSSNSPRSPSPGSVTSVTSTSPLLGSRPREAHGRSRQRSQTVSGAGIRTHDVTPIKEGTFSGSDLWRRKYIGRQIECVVCLEEYVDGQSQVMSLPCGHEFHAECITPWLTTRRRTCPICKGDVVRSMALAEPTGNQEHTSLVHTASVPIIPDVTDDSHLEEGRRVDEPSLSADSNNDVESNTNAASSSTAHQSDWRNLSSMSFSVLSGDAMWHSSRNDRSR